jgi:hypothetical protein
VRHAKKLEMLVGIAGIGADRTLEQRAVADQLDDTALVPCDERVELRLPVTDQGRQCAGLVRPISRA